eukprot:gene18606-22266_t
MSSVPSGVGTGLNLTLMVNGQEALETLTLDYETPTIFGLVSQTNNMFTLDGINMGN